MLLRHPSKFYIYYLFSERRLDVGGIIQVLGDACLPVPQTKKDLKKFVELLRNERKKVRVPANFNPLRRPINQETDTFLRDWRVRAMWSHDPQADAALDILVGEPVLRQFMDTLLLGPLSRDHIAARIRQFFSLSEERMNVGVVRMYEHYFWNRALLDRQEWKGILFDWMPKLNPQFLTSLNATHDAVGASLSLQAAGMSNSLSSVHVYQSARDHLFRMFTEHTLQAPSLSRTQAACMAIQGVTHAEEQLERHRGGSADLLEAFQRIETAYDVNRLTTINDLPIIPKALPTGELAPPEPELADEPPQEIPEEPPELPEE